MTNSRSPEWERERESVDILAILSSIDGRRAIIRSQAWHEGSWDVVYNEATTMKGELAILKALLSEHWERLFEIARAGE